MPCSVKTVYSGEEHKRVNIIHLVFLAFSTSFDVTRFSCNESNAHCKEPIATCSGDAVMERVVLSGLKSCLKQ